MNETNYALTLHNIGSDTLDNDGSVAGSDGAMTPSFLDGLIYEAHYSGPPTQDTTVDFGFFIPLFSLGNQVWFDDNNNGLIDPLETFVDSALVILHYYDPGSMTCYVLDSQYTDSNGFNQALSGVQLQPGPLLRDLGDIGVGVGAVSYTHLDVYKRQVGVLLPLRLAGGTTPTIYFPSNRPSK